MEEKQKIEELERRIATLEKQIKVLTDSVKPAREKLKIEELEVERINIVEKDGTVRICIHSKDRIPCKRRSQAGMLFFAEDGSEIGGLNINDTISLMLDQYHADQVVGLVNSQVDEFGNEVEGETDETTQYVKGLQIWDLPPGSISEFRKQFEVDNGRQPSPQEIWRNRVFSGRWFNGEAKTSLSDSKGRERIRLIVDSNDIPRIELLDENGVTIHCLAPESFKPLRFPPTDKLPQNQVGQLPTDLLAVFDNDLDKVLRIVEATHGKLGEEVYVAWRDWLLEAKAMNSTSIAD